MARLCLVSDSLLVYFLVFAGVSSVFTHSEYYSYFTDAPQKSDATIAFKQIPHRVRRETSNVTDPASIESSTVLTTSQNSSLSKPIKPIASNGTTKTLPNKAGDSNRTASVTQKPIVLPSERTLTNSNMSSVLSGTSASKDQGELRLNASLEADITPYDTKETLEKELLERNITVHRTDSHLYYNSSFNADPDVGKALWVDMVNRTEVKTNELLTNSHRKAATVMLSFDFPFYGHLVRNVTIATGGFVYAGDYVHTWLAATQYIAPLMANFDTSLSNDSCIKYVDNGTAFTVQWERVRLQDKPDEGEFTFQVTLCSTGDIVFVYKDVPVFIENIQEDQHPVKVGLSDAYIMDHTVFFVRRKTIYEYHRVTFTKEDIKNWTSIYLTALPTCLGSKDCNSCLEKDNLTFECKWCPSANRCSNGLDRYRQDWITKYCDKKNVAFAEDCSRTSDHFLNPIDSSDQDVYKNSLEENGQASKGAYHSNSVLQGDEKVPMGVSGIVAVIFITMMVTGLGVWVFYAYRNPHTTSGQMLIRYRPSQWRWRRGEPRYTVATIHM